MTTWYRAGTVSVTNGSTTVTGSGTAFIGNVLPGHGINLPDGRQYEVAAIVSNTQLTLGSPYLGSTASGQSYSVTPTQGLIRDFQAAVSQWITDQQAYVDGPLSGRFGAGTAAAPGVAFTGDTDTGLARLGANILGLIAGGSERARLTTSGMQVTGLLTGTAVTQSAVDATADRLLKVGDFGLGNTGTRLLPNNSAADGAPSGLYNTDANTLNLGELAATNGAMLVLARGSGSSNPGGTQIWRRSAAQLVWRSFAHGTAGPWREFIHTGNILGTVAQSGGVPTGALIERGANANGEYVRFADGTQICRHAVDLGSIVLAGSGTYADPYRTASQTWTYPAGFSGVPTVTVSPSIGADVGIRNQIAASVRTVFSNSARISAGRMSADSTADNVTAYCIAVGRWF